MNQRASTDTEGAAATRLPVLIVDDQPGIVEALEVLLDLHEIPRLTASGPDEALAVAANQPLGAVVQDMNFQRDETSGAAGTELFHALREAQPGVPILLMTAWGSLESAVELVREGAADYIQKPWDDGKLVLALRNLVRLRQLELENTQLRRERQAARTDLAGRYDLRGLIYGSEEMHRVVSLATNVAASNAPVLITGPSGSGKERIAEILQANSGRRGKPFIKVNVGAIPDELIESELFGAEAGAYTGRTGRRIGHFEAANGGTLFLDEIDSLSLSGQVKLLRVLQSGEFQRLGSSATQTVDVRVLSASNAELKEALAEGRFREDLYFRLNVVEIQVPELARRPEDILPLSDYFLSRFALADASGSGGHTHRRLDAKARAALLQHPWPGNVRELENCLQRAMVVAQGDEIRVEDLGLTRSQPDPPPLPALRELSGQELSERQRLLSVLEEEGGVISRVARRLGLSRQALYRRMARLGIEMERRPKD